MQGKIICITNRHLVEDNFLKQIERIAKANVDSIVLREKDLTEKEYEKIADETHQICQENHIECIYHSFFDIARKHVADGFHFTGEQLKSGCKQDLDLLWSKQEYHPKIGMGIHTKEEAKLAKKYKMDYVFVSHIFPTECKKNIPQKGLEFISEIKKELTIPVYALGGIHKENAADCIRYGADGVCLMSDFMKSKEPKVLVEKIRRS